MANGQPEVSADNKTVTVHLKEGIHFSPPVNREVTSEDVAYAIERGANPNVANPYIQTYFKSIEGIANRPTAARSRASKRRTSTRSSSISTNRRVSSWPRRWCCR